MIVVNIISLILIRTLIVYYYFTMNRPVLHSNICYSTFCRYPTVVCFYFRMDSSTEKYMYSGSVQRMVSALENTGPTQLLNVTTTILATIQPTLSEADVCTMHPYLNC